MLGPTGEPSWGRVGRGRRRRLVDPVALIGIPLAAILYARGLRRLGERPRFHATWRPDALDAPHVMWLAPQAAFAQTQSGEELQIQQDDGETTLDQNAQSTDTESQGETVIEQQATDEPAREDERPTT